MAEISSRTVAVEEGEPIEVGKECGLLSSCDQEARLCE